MTNDFTEFRPRRYFSFRRLDFDTITFLSLFLLLAVEIFI